MLADGHGSGAGDVRQPPRAAPPSTRCSPPTSPARPVAAEGDQLRQRGRRSRRGRGRAGRRLWLDAVTDFDGARPHRVAWSRAEWVEATMPLWTRPRRAGRSRGRPLPWARPRGSARPAGRARLSSGGARRPGHRPGLPAGMLDQPAPMLAPHAAARCSRMQLGQARRHARPRGASPGTEVGAPARPRPHRRADAGRRREFADGLEVDADQVRLYLAVREAARVRLFGAVPWLATAAAGGGARLRRRHQHRHRGHRGGARLDRPVRPRGACSRRCRTGCSARAEPRPAAALGRLETLLALVEGWVDVVADRATRAHLPQADALGEAVRRRRATGGPAEKAFAVPSSASSCGRVGCATRRTCSRRSRTPVGPQRPRRRLAPPRPGAEHRRPRRPAGLRRPTARPQTDEMDAALDRLLSGEDDT